MELSRRDIRRGLSDADREQFAATFGVDTAQMTVPRAHRASPWSTSEVATLRRLAHEGMPAATIAETLGRSLASIRQAAHRARISLRRPGERRGLVLGQPRNTRWRDPLTRRHTALLEIRAGVLAGTIDVATLEMIAMRPALLARGAALCPSCTARPQENEKTGLCTDCHLDALADAHAADSSHRQSLRRYNTEKQRSHRRRRNEDQES